VHKTIGYICLLLAFCAPQQLSSKQQQQPSGPPRLDIPQSDESDPSLPPRIQKEMEKKANEQRHTDLKRDTDRLLKLSTELKEYVDKSNSNILSLDVIKKADEIERLAHSVKTRMRGNN
jgi:geranylgeranyl pyrophosphate synthase